MGSASGASATVPSRSAAIAWRLATVVDVRIETPRTRTLVLDVPGWPGHRAGQHVDVRVTAEDGYQAQRSYSIASAPQDVGVADGRPTGRRRSLATSHRRAEKRRSTRAPGADRRPL